MKLVALVQDLKAVARFLHHLGEPAEPPPLAPARGPPFWKSRVLRRRPLAPAPQAQMFDS